MLTTAKAALLVPVLLILLSVYALLLALGGTEEHVVLLSDHQLPRGMVLALGLIGVGCGALTICTLLIDQKLKV